MMAELGQGQVQPLVDEPSSFSPPSWSPDGDSLAFVQWTGRGVGSLVVLDTVSRRLITASNWARDVAWLDDERVLYARADPSGNPAGLVSQRLDGSRPVVAGLFVVEVGDEERVRELSVAGAIGRGQSVAPDGHSIALVTGVLKPVSGGQKLSLYDVGRNALRELPIMVDPPWDVAWSPR